MSQAQLKRLIARARHIQDVLEQVKPLYTELDEITWQLALGQHPNLEQFGVILKDNFSKKNVSWKATGIRRFELIVSNSRLTRL